MKNAIQSLEILAVILQQISLPAVAAEGQLSHRVITEHLQTIQAALQPPTDEHGNMPSISPTKDDQPC